MSDTPAWVAAKANKYARDHALLRLSAHQGLYNAAKRDEGMAFAPWEALGGGKFEKTGQVEAMEKAGDEGRAVQVTQYHAT